MKRYALIGRRLGHSYSQQWFTDLFARLGLTDHRYDLCELHSVDGLREWANSKGICGFNVTVPFKIDVIGELDALDDTAAAIGAVNCVTVEDGCLIGHNTDAPAFAETLMPLLPSLYGISAIVLGTGGAARAVAYALQGLGISPTLVSRTPEKLKKERGKWEIISYDHISHLTFHLSPLIVNATPVGMYPDIDRSPLDITQLSSLAIHHPSLVYDLIYNPSPTLLMKQAASRGVKTVDGLAMLHRQAELSWELFKNN